MEMTGLSIRSGHKKVVVGRRSTVQCLEQPHRKRDSVSTVGMSVKAVQFSI